MMMHNNHLYGIYDYKEYYVDEKTYRLHIANNIDENKVVNYFLPYYNEEYSFKQKKIIYIADSYQSVLQIPTFSFINYLISNMFFDRTKIIKAPDFLEQKHILQNTKTDKSFSDICLKRLKELEIKAKDFEQIALFWSGGLDSTCIICVLLNHATPELLNKITVHITSSSIDEYRLFYECHIKNLKHIIYDEDRLIVDFNFTNQLIITGEGGDQMFGSMLPYRMSHSDDATDWQQAMRKACNYILNKKDVSKAEMVFQQFSEYILRCEKKFNIKLDTIKKIGNWLNFTHKMQSVDYRLISSISTFYSLPKNINNQLFNFFIDKMFDAWHISNLDEIHQVQYKHVMRQIIFNFTDDDDYALNKKKEFSLRYGSNYMGLLLDDFTAINSTYDNRMHINRTLDYLRDIARQYNDSINTSGIFND